MKVNEDEHREVKAFIAGAVNNVARYCYAHDNPDPDDARTGHRTVKDWVKLVDAQYDEEIRGVKPAPIGALAEEQKGVARKIVEAPVHLFKSTGEKILDTFKKIGHAMDPRPDKKPEETKEEA